MPEIILENSALWLFPIAALSFVGAWILYYRSKQFSKNKRLALAMLRFLVFFFIGFLLLSPLLKSTEIREEKPILVWLEDHSRSMVLNSDSQKVKQLLSVVSDSLLEELQSRYQVEKLNFGSAISLPSDTFKQTSTNIYEALHAVKERYYNQNVGAVVMLSDGISNTGNNPAYAASSVDFPIYTVGLGDTVQRKDLFIDRIVTNDVSYRGNNLPVEIYMKARQLNTENYTLTINDVKGNRVFEKSFTIDGDDYFKRVDLFLKSEKTGLQEYTVQLSPLANEVNLQNNRASFTVDILDNRKKIVIIGRGPHPDMGAIAKSLADLEKYEVQTYIEGEIPTEEIQAQLLILHNPSARILEQFNTKNVPFWIFQGPATPSSALATVGINSGDRSFEEAYAEIVPGFNLFSLSDEEIGFADELPPLWSPFGRAMAKDRIYPLFHKKIGSVVTDDPLWFFIQAENSRKAFTLGTGIWRWRMYDYKENRSHERFDGLISKTVQYLTSTNLQRYFVVDIAGKFEQSENILAEARLYNESLELVNVPDLKITFTNEDGKSFTFNFAKSQHTYRLNAGKLPKGIYNWSSTVTFGDKSFTQRGNLVVEKSLLEESDLVARHQLLRNIAKGSGGNFYRSDQLAKLGENLLKNDQAKSYQILEINTGNLIDQRWLFIIFLLLLASEWGLRKYFGNY